MTDSAKLSLKVVLSCINRAIQPGLMSSAEALEFIEELDDEVTSLRIALRKSKG